MHAKLLVCVEKTSRLAVVVSQFEDRRMRGCENRVGGGNVGRCGGLCRNSDSARGCKELVLIQLHGISTRHERWGCE